MPHPGQKLQTTSTPPRRLLPHTLYTIANARQSTGTRLWYVCLVSHMHRSTVIFNEDLTPHTGRAFLLNS